MIRSGARCFSSWLLAGAVLACASAPLAAQTAEPATTKAEPAFALEIAAPPEVQALLTRHLELQRYRELSDLSDAEIDRLLSAARQDTQELLATLGYFSPEISIERTASASSTTARLVKLSVSPGEPSLVRAVRITFKGAINSDATAQQQRQQIESNWALPVGRRFTQTGWDDAKRLALRQLTTLRYASGQLGETLADIDPAQHSAQLSITLESGPDYHLGALLVSGTEHHSDEMVTRLARLTPGTEYAQAELTKAQQRLIASGYFDSAFIALDPTGDPLAAPLRVQVHEARLQKLVLGTGATTDAGLHLTAEHTHNQLPGIGWRAISKLLLDRDTQSLGSELTAPPDENNWRWRAAARWLREPVGSFEVNSQQLVAGRSQTDEHIERHYYLQFDRSASVATDTSAPDLAQALSANYAFTLRNFDQLPFPSSGWGLGVELGGGSTLSGTRDPYGRIVARWLGYLPLGSDSAARRTGRLVLRAQAGAVLASDTAALPSTQLFLTGGDTSVRGYAYQTLGVTLPDGEITAGRYLGIGSLEWQRPIVANNQLTDWEAALFIDAGAVADTPRELRARVGYGVGARWKSPVGPLQIDLAYGVAVQRFRLHMNLGFTF
jgi:translocation and assembly module TamA